MNTDIRISVTFLQNPKIKKLERRVGLEGLKALLALWIWTAQNKPTGDLAGLDDESVEMAADWAGDEGVFVQALKALRLLDGEEGSYCIHDWVENNGWAANESDRADTSRFNRMKGVAAYKTIHDTLAEAGVSRISKEDYELLRNSGERQAVVERLLKNASSTSEGDSKEAHEENEPTLKASLSNTQASLNDCSSTAPRSSDNRLSNALSPSPTPSPAPRPMPAPLASNANSASGDAPRTQPEPAPAQKPASKPKPRPVLEGRSLELFNQFWDAFDFKQSRKQAEKAWADISGMTEELAAKICEAARREAALRPQYTARGRTPKYPQGWLNDRRWEDDYDQREAMESQQAMPRQGSLFDAGQRQQGQPKTWAEINDEKMKQDCLKGMYDYMDMMGIPHEENDNAAEQPREYWTAEVIDE